ncbi:uncharacterized protein LOC107964765 [Apis mellifera]|uniref:Uncharacterized protein LOC107964765 n=1 Tax=Apis mellifera TaxID=7460 RepID=A0A7M7MLJ5_APIME|nr:uncharacterized protein LOC107964765 [Apis mellifera]|eukprot:XP_026297741.1 uncharacterized protein LOC107964765 [Apis mellifera]
MCATNPPYGSRSSENSADDARFHQPHPPHPPPPYIYYPPPYPHFHPYYPYHPGFYSPHYYNDISQESKGSLGFSWFNIVLLLFLLLCIVSIVFYWSLSRDTRRRLNGRLPPLVQPAQVNLASGC